MKHAITELLRDLRVGRSFQHVSGPKHVHLDPDQAGLVLLAKDVEWHLPEYLNYHLSIGVSHILVVDNGSTDRTLEIASRDKVTVLRSTLPAKLFESRLRAVAAKRIFRGGWIMFADADEMVEMPTRCSLTRLLTYANKRGFTAVLGQMIDFYDPAAPDNGDYGSSVARATHYSLGDMDRIPYTDTSFFLHWFLKDNTCIDSEIRILRGGLRREIFGENPLLTKHTLVRNTPPSKVMTHPHCASRVAVADLTIAVRHYKLAGDSVSRDRATVKTAAWDHGEDARRLEAVGQEAFSISPADAKIWRGSDALLDEGFLYASPVARSALLGTA